MTDILTPTTPTTTSAQSSLVGGVRVATTADLDTIVTLLTEPFLGSRLAEWLVPHERTRASICRGYLAIHAAHLLHVGFGHISTDRSAVALWLPRPGRVPPPVDYDEELADVCGPWLRRFQLFDALLVEHHPATAHHYLAFLATAEHPEPGMVAARAAAVLAHHHRLLDRAAMPAYLEASTLDGKLFAQANGYTMAATAPLHLPEGGPSIIPMWRPPHTEGTRSDESGDRR